MASLKELDAMVDGMNLKEMSLHRICEGCVVATPLWPSVGVKPNTWKS